MSKRPSRRQQVGIQGKRSRYEDDGTLQRIITNSRGNTAYEIRDFHGSSLGG